MDLKELEKRILDRIKSGELKGRISPSWDAGKSTCWREIKDGIVYVFKQGPGGKIFDGKENTRYEGVLHVLEKIVEPQEMLKFFQKYGFLSSDPDLKLYSSFFKPKK